MTDQFKVVFKADPDWPKQRGKLSELSVSYIALCLLSSECYSGYVWG